MQTDKRKVEVTLLGQRFTVRSDQSDAYVNELARYVGNQVEAIRRQTRTVSTHQLSLLVALNLADQLFQKEKQLTELKKQVAKETSAALADVNKTIADLDQTGVAVEEMMF